MATKRKRSSSSWEFIIRRKGLLPKPVYLTFSDEKEGDEYVKRVEALLDRGVVPPELLADRADSVKTLADAIRAYRLAVAVPATYAALLAVVQDRQGSKTLSTINYPWAESWVASMKRESGLSPSTIRHYVGATARCLDWMVRKSPELLPGNPLRLLPKRYAAYTDADTAAGCPDLRFHDLRHEATSRLFERTNLSDLQIAKITGHKDPRMLARYANLRGSDLAGALW